MKLGIFLDFSDSYTVGIENPRKLPNLRITTAGWQGGFMASVTGTGGQKSQFLTPENWIWGVSLTPRNGVSRGQIWPPGQFWGVNLTPWKPRFGGSQGVKLGLPASLGGHSRGGKTPSCESCFFALRGVAGGSFLAPQASLAPQ